MKLNLAAFLATNDDFSIYHAFMQTGDARRSASATLRYRCLSDRGRGTAPAVIAVDMHGVLGGVAVGGEGAKRAVGGEAG